MSALLALLGDCGHAATPALARSAGMTPERVRERLRALVDLGLCKKTVVGVNCPDRFSLTPPGRRLVCEKLGRSPEEVAVARVGAGPFAHHDTCVEFAVCLREACARVERVALQRYFFERQVRHLLGSTGGALVPDGIAELVGPGPQALVLALEADAATCDPKWVVTNKFSVYAEHHAARGTLAGARLWRVVVVAPSLRRVHQLATALWREGLPEGLFFFQVRGAIDARTMLLPTWLTPRAVAGTEDAALVLASPLVGPLADPSTGWASLGVEERASVDDSQAGASRRSGARSAP